jgi:hypothetical protein
VPRIICPPSAALSSRPIETDRYPKPAELPRAVAGTPFARRLAIPPTAAEKH